MLRQKCRGVQAQPLGQKQPLQFPDTPGPHTGSKGLQTKAAVLLVEAMTSPENSLDSPCQSQSQLLPGVQQSTGLGKKDGGWAVGRLLRLQ